MHLFFDIKTLKIIFINENFGCNEMNLFSRIPDRTLRYIVKGVICNIGDYEKLRIRVKIIYKVHSMFTIFSVK